MKRKLSLETPLPFQEQELNDLTGIDPSILTIGALPQDCMVYPELDHPLRLPGGSALNIACHMRLLEMPAALVGVVGNDYPGRQCRKMAKAFGIDTGLLATKPKGRTRILPIEIFPRGKGTPAHRFVHIEPDHPYLTASDIHLTGLEDRLAAASKWLHLDACNQKLRVLAETFVALGIPVSYDYGRPPIHGLEPVHQLLRSVHVLKSNAHLISQLGCADKPELFFEENPKLKILYITDEAREQRLWLRRQDGIQEFRCPTIAVPSMVDSLGAGDASVSMLIHGLLQVSSKPDDWAAASSGNIEIILRRCVAMSALCCQFPAGSGHLFWMRENDSTPQSLIRHIIENGKLPEDWNWSPVQIEKHLQAILQD